MTQLVNKLLYLESTVPIGSIALGIANEDSDLDLCVLNSDLTKDTISSLVKNSIGKILQQTYDDSLLIQHSVLYQCPDTDIFVFQDEAKLAIVHKVMYMLSRYPKFILRIKWIRVAMFRKMLINEGFLDEPANGPITNISSQRP